ncbi:hypothetical protein C8F01DRAFT_718983 [Mycena amicta]|nr:hypothetical protein C8F01DRAFT_718983 [Mycena amicta]
MHLHPSETTQLHPPPEICALICGLVDRETLLHLGKVSRVFHHQAQRGIYHTVDLRPGPSEAFISWCRAVSRDPQLGVYLHSLTLCAPTVEESERLAHVLNNCPNLKRLAVLSRSSSKSYEEDHRDSCHTWATDKAPFRLTHLADYSGKTFMSAFWNTQTEIRLLSLPSREKQVFPCHEDQLPNLVALEVASTDGLPMTARPIERIQLRQHHPKNFEVFRRFSASLTTLNLCGLRDIISTIMNLLCYELPNLLHLGIAQDPNVSARTVSPHPINDAHATQELRPLRKPRRDSLRFDDRSQLRP